MGKREGKPKIVPPNKFISMKINSTPTDFRPRYSSFIIIVVVVVVDNNSSFPSVENENENENETNN